MTVKEKRRIIWFLALLCVLLTVFILTRSLKPADLSDAESMAVGSWLRDIFDPHRLMTDDLFDHYVRKTAHFLEFATLCGCYTVLKIIVTNKLLDVFNLLPLFGSLLTANVDEFIQLFVEGRGSQVQDVFLDFYGAITGMIAVTVIVLIIRLVKKRPLHIL